jgi:transketolase
VGSALSVTDILAVIYGGVATVDPANPGWPERDRIILSKGHAGAAMYAALAESGFFSVDELEHYYQDGSSLSGHVSHKDVPGVDASTGSLGHGLPIGAGMALGAQRAQKAWRVFVIMGDGECDEGSVWEAAMFAAHHRLNNLKVVVDYNNLQSLTSVTETLGLEPFPEKWRAFGWRCTEVDGHDHGALVEALTAEHPQPHCVVARTVKGRGVSFMEGKVEWHYRAPDDDTLAEALVELT